MRVCVRVCACAVSCDLVFGSVERGDVDFLHVLCDAVVVVVVAEDSVWASNLLCWAAGGVLCVAELNLGEEGLVACEHTGQADMAWATKVVLQISNGNGFARVEGIGDDGRCWVGLHQLHLVRKVLLLNVVQCRCRLPRLGHLP